MTQPSKITVKRTRPYHMYEMNVSGNGYTIEAHEWRYEWIEVENKDGDPVPVRVSDWTDSEVNPETGREIVHVFYIKTTDGKVNTVSKETAARLVGLTVSQLNSAVNVSVNREDFIAGVIAGTERIAKSDARKSLEKKCAKFSVDIEDLLARTYAAALSKDMINAAYSNNVSYVRRHGNATVARFSYEFIKFVFSGLNNGNIARTEEIEKNEAARREMYEKRQAAEAARKAKAVAKYGQAFVDKFGY